MIKFYYNLAPNPTKVALALEEMGLPYELVPVDTRKGDQHKPEFLAINPNAKVPAIVDEGTPIFDSNATAFLAHVMLFAFGSGPVKGFAVTLSLGIITSMFTAIMFTRGLVNLIFGGRNFKKLWI